jgi:hypothetical protein
VIAHWKQLVGPIKTKEEAEKTLRKLAKGWYVVGVLMMLIYSLLSLSGKGSFLNIGDGVLYFIVGYLLPRTKSRTLASAVFLWSIIMACLTIAANAGLYIGGGKNIVLALIVAGMGYLGLKATWVYQRDSRVSRKNVAIVSGVTVLGSIVALAFTLVVLTVKNPNWGNVISDDEAGVYFLTPLLFVWGLCFGLLTKKFPLTRLEQNV